MHRANVVIDEVQRRGVRGGHVDDQIALDRVGRVAGRVFCNHFVVALAFGVAGVDRDFPVAVRANDGRANNLARVLVADHDRVARISVVATEHRVGFVGGTAIADRVAIAVNHFERHVCRRGRVNFHDHRGRGCGLVACRVSHHDAELVVAFVQRVRRGVGPVAAWVNDGRADHLVAVADEHGVAWGQATAGQRRGGVVGHAAPVHDGDRALDRTNIVQDGANAAGIRGGGVDREVPGARGRAFAGGRRLHRGRQAVLAFGQHWRGEAPVAAGINRGRTQQGLGATHAVVDAHDAARRAAARRGGRRVVGHTMVGDRALVHTNVIQHLRERDVDVARVDREVDRGGDRAGIACAVHRLGAQRVVAVRQGRLRLPAPVAAAGHHGAADDGAVVADDDGVAGVALAREGRVGVVGLVTAVDLALDRTNVVDQLQLAGVQRTRGGRVHDDRERAGFRARVACGIAGNGGQLVTAFAQRRARFDRPLAVGANQPRADGCAVCVQGHHHARNGRACDGRGGVVGDVARLQRALDRTHVVHHTGDGRRRRRATRDEVEVERVARVADVARRVVRTCGQVIGAVVQVHGRLPLPLAGSIRLGAAQQRAAVVDVHHGVGLGRAGDGRSGVISRVTTAQRPLHRANVVIDEVQRRGVRGRGVND